MALQEDSGNDIVKIYLDINNREYCVQVSIRETLLNVLRNQLGLTGTKYGCGEGECGACSIIMEGKLVNACLVLAPQAEGKEILTIEGFEQDDVLQKLQSAFVKKGAVQCGFCSPGMIMAAKALLIKNPDPTRDEIREAISGNLCRCTGYSKIIDAIESVKL